MPLPVFLPGRTRTSIEAIPFGSDLFSATKERRDSQLNSSEPQNKILRGAETLGVLELLLIVKSREWNPWIENGFDGCTIRPSTARDVLALSFMIVDNCSQHKFSLRYTWIMVEVRPITPHNHNSRATPTTPPIFLCESFCVTCCQL